MNQVQHFVSVSGGKDSAAVACLSVERAQRRGFPVRYLFSDTGNENQITLDHVGYIAQHLGINIETVRADFTDRFEPRRIAIAKDWPKELRRKQHTVRCRELCSADMGYAERVVFRDECACPIKVSPPLPDDLIRRAIDLMQPTGNPFLDMAMLHGRFPGSKSRFCTDELKIMPMAAVKDPVRFSGTPIIEWIGERADESDARAKKPAMEIERCSFRAPAILYRPIHALTALDVFAIAKRHGLKPNPLYMMGMSRVGCFPCIMCGKEELREIARRFPDAIARIAEWELICGGVARHAYTALVRGERKILVSSFLPMDKLPPDGNGKTRPTIHRAVEWSQTSRGGRNFDLEHFLQDLDFDAEAPRCSSRYQLCE